jgi:AraC-like DNA-binding protein
MFLPLLHKVLRYISILVIAFIRVLHIGDSNYIIEADRSGGATMINIRTFCEYLYGSLYIPIYFFEEKEIKHCFPPLPDTTTPPTIYLDRLWESEKIVSYTMTTFYSYYGCVKIGNTDASIVIGPINDFPYSTKILDSIKKDFETQQAITETFFDFFRKIPTQNLDTFINTLLFINFTLNLTELTKKDVELVDYEFEKDINKEFIEKTYEAKEEELLYNSYDIENMMIRFVETGNVQRLKEFSDRARHTKVGIIADNSLRQWKNMFIVAVTLTSRAAMRGGLTPSLAYQLSNIYLQQVERLTDVDAVQSLLGQVRLDYANRVAKSIVPISADHVLHQVVQFARENTNKHITVFEVADHVGYSRSALSRKVKKELGFELSSFIRKCKLEEAKDLLLFSNKSISEISNYLCFSSQSHFQRAFKDQFNVTPNAYRKSLS